MGRDSRKTQHKQEAIDLLRQGINPVLVAEHCGISLSYVNCLARVKKIGRSKEVTEAQMLEVLRLYDETEMSINSIAEAVGVTSSLVQTLTGGKGDREFVQGFAVDPSEPVDEGIGLLDSGPVDPGERGTGEPWGQSEADGELSRYLEVRKRRFIRQKPYEFPVVNLRDTGLNLIPD